MRINRGLIRYLGVLSWRYVRIVLNDILAGRNPVRIYIQSYQRYKKHGLSIMLNRLNREYSQLSSNEKGVDYLTWRERNERIEKRCEASGPLISIVMPTYNPNEQLLFEAIASVQEQTYPLWELCIADDASHAAGTCALIEKAAGRDERIRYVCRKENGHISQATNSALSLCRGDWVVFLDHDDLLRKDALCEVVKAVNAHDDIALIYSDEDKVDGDGERSDPFFKPDWNPDLLRSQNYIAHLCAIRRDVVAAVGGLREGFEGSQDYDLILRASAMLKDEQIKHIPQVLYHWRKLPGSVAMDAQAKPYAWENGRKALQSYLDIVSPGAVAAYGMQRHTYKVDYPLANEPKVSLIIPTRDGYSVLHRCVASIFANTLYKNYEIIIVDNQSQDHRTLAYIEKIAKLPNVRVLQYDAPFNFSAINNMAVREAEGEIIGLLNDDIEIITEGWLQELVKLAMRPDIGAVGAKLYYDNDTIQHAGVILGIGGVAGHSHKHFSRKSPGYFSRLQLLQNYSAVTGACLVVHKALYESVGGFDEAHLAVAFNDVDFCLKLKSAGYRNLWTPYVEAYHHESVSRGSENTIEKIERFDTETKYMLQRWKSNLCCDPCYTPNLCKENGDFSLGVLK